MKTAKKILIIEDDPHIMRALASILEKEGYSLDCVSTRQDALNIVRSFSPDLFLLDLGLPDMDGLQVIQQLRQQTVRPIIIISARAQEDEKVLALDYGADDYVTKPFGAKELKARIPALWLGQTAYGIQAVKGRLPGRSERFPACLEGMCGRRNIYLSKTRFVK